MTTTQMFHNKTNNDSTNNNENSCNEKQNHHLLHLILSPTCHSDLTDSGSEDALFSDDEEDTSDEEDEVEEKLVDDDDNPNAQWKNRDDRLRPALEHVFLLSEQDWNCKTPPLLAATASSFKSASLSSSSSSSLSSTPRSCQRSSASSSLMLQPPPCILRFEHYAAAAATKHTSSFKFLFDLDPDIESSNDDDDDDEDDETFHIYQFQPPPPSPPAKSFGSGKHQHQQPLGAFPTVHDIPWSTPSLPSLVAAPTPSLLSFQQRSLSNNVQHTSRLSLSSSSSSACLQQPQPIPPTKTLTPPRTRTLPPASPPTPYTTLGIQPLILRSSSSNQRLPFSCYNTSRSYNNAKLCMTTPSTATSLSASSSSSSSTTIPSPFKPLTPPPAADAKRRNYLTDLQPTLLLRPMSIWLPTPTTTTTSTSTSCLQHDDVQQRPKDNDDVDSLKKPSPVARSSQPHQQQQHSTGLLFPTSGSSNGLEYESHDGCIMRKEDEGIGDDWNSHYYDNNELFQLLSLTRTTMAAAESPVSTPQHHPQQPKQNQDQLQPLQPQQDCLSEQQYLSPQSRSNGSRIGTCVRTILPAATPTTTRRVGAAQRDEAPTDEWEVDEEESDDDDDDDEEDDQVDHDDHKNGDGGWTKHCHHHPYDLCELDWLTDEADTLSTMTDGKMSHSQNSCSSNGSSSCGWYEEEEEQVENSDDNDK